MYDDNYKVGTVEDVQEQERHSAVWINPLHDNGIHVQLVTLIIETGLWTVLRNVLSVSLYSSLSWGMETRIGYGPSASLATHDSGISLFSLSGAKTSIQCSSISQNYHVGGKHTTVTVTWIIMVIQVTGTCTVSIWYSTLSVIYTCNYISLK